MFERIQILLKERGITQTKMLKDLGFSTGLFSQWKRGLQNPSPSKVKAIADYLDTTTGYLVSGTIYPRNAEPADFSNSESFPILGKVAAGLGSYADPDNIVGYKLAESDEITDGYDHAWLQVEGDSMEPELHDGDYVFVRIQDYAETGDLAVVLVDDELGVVKKIEYQENHHITLISFNSNYEPKTFIKEDMNRIRIFGKVVGMRRRFW